MTEPVFKTVYVLTKNNTTVKVQALSNYDTSGPSSFR